MPFLWSIMTIFLYDYDRWKFPSLNRKLNDVVTGGTTVPSRKKRRVLKCTFNSLTST